MFTKLPKVSEKRKKSHIFNEIEKFFINFINKMSFLSTFRKPQIKFFFVKLQGIFQFFQLIAKNDSFFFSNAKSVSQFFYKV